MTQEDINDLRSKNPSPELRIQLGYEKTHDDCDQGNPKCWCGKIATVVCVTCLSDLCSKHSEDEHILRGHETT